MIYVVFNLRFLFGWFFSFLLLLISAESVQSTRWKEKFDAKVEIATKASPRKCPILLILPCTVYRLSDQRDKALFRDHFPPITWLGRYRISTLPLHIAGLVVTLRN